MKHKKKIPTFELPQGRGFPPAETRRLFEVWVVDVAVKIGTWGPDASGQWMSIVHEARQKQDTWLLWSPDERAKVG
eukprot:5023568-Prorocentrum_lima.AAC.1